MATVNQSGKIAVTGVTGFVGKYLCEGLRLVGYAVRELSRNGGVGEDQFATGDLAGDPDWQQCLQGVHTVIHCAAVAHVPLKKHSSAEGYLARVNVQAVDSLAKACREAGVSRLIFLSSVKVYGESTTGRSPFTENDPARPEDAYGRSKYGAEEILRRHHCEQLQICALRLPLVYGAEPKANFARLQKLVLSGVPLPLAGLDNRRSVLALVNLLAVVQCLLEKKHWPFFALNVADPEPVSTVELVRVIAESSRRQARIFYFPGSWLRCFARIVGLGVFIDKLTGDLDVSVERLRGQLPEAQLIPTASAFQCMQNGTLRARKVTVN